MTYDAFRDAERAGWDARAEGYARRTWRATGQIAPALLDALRLRPGDRVLDIACGPGHLAAAASALGMRAEGIDVAPEMIAQAKRLFPDLTVREGDAEALPHADANFDAVCCNMGLFHMGDPARAVSEAARVLRPGGRFAWSHWAAPSESPLYGTLMETLGRIVDPGRAAPAPDAFALASPEAAEMVMEDAGFARFGVRRLETVMLAEGRDFLDAFMAFGVRVPLIVSAQEPEVREALRHALGEAMAPWRTETGYEVPMPSHVFSGEKV